MNIIANIGGSLFIGACVFITAKHNIPLALSQITVLIAYYVISTICLIEKNSKKG